MSDPQETPVVPEVVTTPTAEVVDPNLQPPNSIEETEKVLEDKKTETIAEKKEEPVIKKDPVAAKFAALSREKKEAMSLKAEAQAMMDNAKKINDGIQQHKDDPEKVLELLGFDVDSFLEKVINKKTPERVIQKQEKTEADKRIERLEQEIENNKTAQVQKEYDSLYNTFKQQVTDLVKSKPVDLELLGSEENPVKLVYDYIVAIKNQTGEEKNPDEAAAEIEAFLQSEEDKRLEKLSKTNKYKSRFATEPQALASDKKDDPTVKGSKTLSAEIPLAPTTSGKKLSYEESLKETIKEHYKPTKRN